MSKQGRDGDRLNRPGRNGAGRRDARRPGAGHDIPRDGAGRQPIPLGGNRGWADGPGDVPTQGDLRRPGLVLTRNVDERVVVTLPDGRRMYVTLVAIRTGERAKLGFNAPSDVQIQREEIQDQIDRERGEFREP